MKMSQCSGSLDGALSPVAILSRRTPERIAERAEKKRWSNYRSVKKTKLIGSLSLRAIARTTHNTRTQRPTWQAPARQDQRFASPAGRVLVTPQNREADHHRSRVTVGHRATVPEELPRTANSEKAHGLHRSSSCPIRERFLEARGAGQAG